MVEEKQQQGERRDVDKGGTEIKEITKGEKDGKEMDKKLE
jgi:hypothetical protein